MRRRLLNLIAMLLTCHCVMGQWHLQIFPAGSKAYDAFDVRNVGEIQFHDHYFNVGQFTYDCNHVDSITVSEQDSEDHRMGWWGIPEEGTIAYYANSGNYRIRYTVTDKNGQCSSVEVELTLLQYVTRASDGNDDNNNHHEGGQEFEDNQGAWEGDPYIFVKSTSTGPRAYEEWTMDDSHGCIVPKNMKHEIRNNKFVFNCTPLLKGRSVGEVRTIIEAWIHQKAQKKYTLN